MKRKMFFFTRSVSTMQNGKATATKSVKTSQLGLSIVEKVANSSHYRLLFIDYLRLTFGKSGTDGQKMRLAVLNASAFSATIEEAVLDTDAAPGGDEFLDLIEDLNKKEKEFVILYFVYGYTKKEIGDRYDLTEARVCQLIKETLAKLKHMLDHK